MRFSELLKGIEEKVRIIKKPNVDVEITGVCFDSNQVKKGDLFVCLQGEQNDGHDFVFEAVKKGAAAIVSEAKTLASVPEAIVEDTRKAVAYLASVFYGNPANRLKIIGVIGTNGKTTVTQMLSSIFQAAGKKVGVIGTLGVRYGKEKKNSDLTTPDPIALYQILKDMADSGVEYVFMETSAHAIHYKKDEGIVYTCCVFTNLSQDHLDFFKDMQTYKNCKEKRILDKAVPLAVINGDDQAGREWIEKRRKQGLKSISYGLETPTDAFAVLTEERLGGSEFMLNLLDKLGSVRLSLTGKHNVYNALAAATCAYALGVDMSAIVLGLRAVKKVAGRLERVAKYKGADVFVDFAHTPDGLQKSLQSLKKHCKGKLICLFGCGGNRDATKRPLMGEYAAEESDYCVITSDNPRYEDPMDIIQQVEKGIRKRSLSYVVVPDRERAIVRALSMLNKGDILLVAGKGGETYQEIMGIKYPFNDNAIIKKSIHFLNGN